MGAPSEVVTVAFRGPGFSTKDKDFAALDLLLDLTFGETSDLYKRLVEQEQKVDQFYPMNFGNQDPYLMTVAARVKKPEDALYVRDEIVKALGAARLQAIAAKRVEDAKSNARYGLVRSLDNTDTIAGALARRCSPVPCGTPSAALIRT